MLHSLASAGQHLGWPAAYRLSVLSGVAWLLREPPKLQRISLEIMQLDAPEDDLIAYPFHQG